MISDSEAKPAPATRGASAIIGKWYYGRSEFEIAPEGDVPQVNAPVFRQTFRNGRQVQCVLEPASEGWDYSVVDHQTGRTLRIAVEWTQQFAGIGESCFRLRCFLEGPEASGSLFYAFRNVYALGKNAGVVVESENSGIILHNGVLVGVVPSSRAAQAPGLLAFLSHKLLRVAHEPLLERARARTVPERSWIDVESWNQQINEGTLLYFSSKPVLSPPSRITVPLTRSPLDILQPGLQLRKRKRAISEDASEGTDAKQSRVQVMPSDTVRLVGEFTGGFMHRLRDNVSAAADARGREILNDLLSVVGGLWSADVVPTGAHAEPKGVVCRVYPSELHPDPQWNSLLLRRLWQVFTSHQIGASGKVALNAWPVERAQGGDVSGVLVMLIRTEQVVQQITEDCWRRSKQGYSQLRFTVLQDRQLAGVPEIEHLFEVAGEWGSQVLLKALADAGCEASCVRHHSDRRGGKRIELLCDWRASQTSKIQDVL